MSLELWLTFVAIWFLAAAAPGPNAAYAIATGLSQPRLRALAAPLGIALAGFIHGSIASAGLGALLVASSDLFLTAKWLGVAYLLWLAWRQFSRSGSINPNITQVPRGPKRIALGAALVSLSNPKTILFYAAILPQFVAPSAPAFAQFAVLTLTTAGISLIVYSGYAILASRIGHWLAGENSYKLLHHLTGGVYLVGAIGLAGLRRLA